MQPETRIDDALRRECDERISAIYSACAAEQPNFGMSEEMLGASLRKTLDRFLQSHSDTSHTAAVVRQLLEQIQTTDLHRAGHDEVSLDEMTETIGEGEAHATFAEQLNDGEREMIDEITRDRYRKATVNAIANAFAGLEDHEKLLLLYYHVENMKLREIAKLVETEGWA